VGKYDAQTATALRLIKKSGAEFTFKRNESTYDPVSGTYSGVDTSFTADAVVLPPTSNTLKQIETLSISLDNKEAYKLIIAKATTQPQNGDKVVIENRDFIIYGLSNLNPAQDGLIIQKAIAVG